MKYNNINFNKKKIHKKIIIYNKVRQLKKVKLNPFTFHYSGVAHKTKPCMCSKLFESKFKHRTFTFYPEVKYLYVELDEMIVLFPRREHIKLYSTKKEFNEHFLDMREYNGFGLKVKEWEERESNGVAERKRWETRGKV